MRECVTNVGHMGLHSRGDHVIAVRLAEPASEVDADHSSFYWRLEDAGTRQPHRIVAGLEMPVQAKCGSVRGAPKFVVVRLTEDVCGQFPNRSLDADGSKDSTFDEDARS